MRHRAHIDPINGNRSTVDFIKTIEQIDNCRLARAGRSDNRDRIAGAGMASIPRSTGSLGS
ncbi:MAG: hypothetical protein R2867_44855 [Caldilineaceae bacterium]